MSAIISNSSLIRTKPLISLKPSHKLHPNHLPAFSPPSPAAGLIFAAKKGNEVLKLSKNDKNPIVVIDNYDSFTYNLCQYMGELELGLSQGYHFEVYRNDELTVAELKRKKPRGVVISPWPGAPQDSGISFRTVLELGPTMPLALERLLEGRLYVLLLVSCMGKALVYYNEKEEADGLLAGLSNPFTAGRYHGLVIEKDSFRSDELEVTAWTEDGLIMAARHKKYKHLHGVQFHPESILTSEGKTK
ncbi:hypothetical protein CUMW_206210 [Citrus unshiu]|uniref:anthranilate synthase n=1 Tax=Citrus unshiu TaxID=55188 RepID=A0A2H5Q8T4_CITUN|nr:hypothetical protein CUMW_206210 [Citrus unshiu]